MTDIYDYKCECGFVTDSSKEIFAHMDNFAPPHRGFKNKFKWQQWKIEVADK